MDKIILHDNKEVKFTKMKCFSHFDFFLRIRGFGKLKFKESYSKASVLPESFLGEIESISDTCLALSTVLYSRGLGQEKVYRLIRDTIKVVESVSVCTISSVNSALESVGWPCHVLDETSFELIREILYTVFEYQVEVHTVQ